MYVKETEGIEISVQTRFEPQFSNPLISRYVFSYHIQIHNKNEYPVQLLRRKWLIRDENKKVEEVEGPGVVGQQPFIEPGCNHSYSSCCDLPTLTGSMQGSYTMCRDDRSSTFEVIVPEFILRVLFNYN